MYMEVQNLRDFELIKSPSKDKRWAIRESGAKISRFCLVSSVMMNNGARNGLSCLHWSLHPDCSVYWFCFCCHISLFFFFRSHLLKCSSLRYVTVAFSLLAISFIRAQSWWGSSSWDWKNDDGYNSQPWNNMWKPTKISVKTTMSSNKTGTAQLDSKQHTATWALVGTTANRCYVKPPQHLGAQSMAWLDKASNSLNASA